MPPALDKDTIAIVDLEPEASFLSKCTIVNGHSSDKQIPISTTLHSPSEARVVAIVDRSADIPSAAHEIVKARIAWGGRSPYAPDLVLVNEFVIQQFTQAVVGQLTKVLATSVPGYKASQVAPYEGTVGSSANGAAKHASPRPARRDGDLSEKDRNEAGASIVLSGEKGAVLNVSKR